MTDAKSTCSLQSQYQYNNVKLLFLAPCAPFQNVKCMYAQTITDT